MNLEQEALAEVDGIHEFFVDWFQGKSDKSALYDNLAARLHEDFEYVQPMARVLSRDVLLNLLDPVHGSNPRFEIEIREPRVTGVWPDCGIVQVTYVEAQFNARMSIPADNLRRSTALFEKRGDRLLWRHIHETGMME